MIVSKLSTSNKFYFTESKIPSIKDDELLIKVLSCAICGSDLKISLSGNSRIKEDRTIGHEISGEIVKIGKSISKFNVGDKVSIGADLPCHKCEKCKSGNVNLCNKNLALGYQFDGGFAQYMIANEYVLNDGPIQKYSKISSDLACLAEPLACAINGVHKSLSCFTIGSPASALIFGGGPMGIMLAEYLYFSGVSDIIISEQNEQRLDFIKSKTKFIPAKLPSKDRKFDLIFTACPSIEAQKQSLNLINVAGVINFFGGLIKDSSKLNIDSNFLHYSEAVLLGTHGSNPSQHREAIELLEKKKIDLNYLITHKFNLINLEKAFHVARSGLGQKIIINPHD